VLFALGSVPALAACSFLLDFNGLQGGQKTSPDAGSDGTGASDSGSSDATGEAGAAGACADAGCDAPNLPAHALLPGAQVQVAWFQPPAAGSGWDEWHFLRHRIGLPQP
jgi:hypothetical protein